MSQIDNIREGLARLATTVETIANTQAAEMPPATVNSISGNAVHGGKITLLRSTGINDKATRTSLLVEDDMITVGSMDVDSLIGDIDVSGALNVQGILTAGKLHVEELSSTQKVTQNIDFRYNQCGRCSNRATHIGTTPMVCVSVSEIKRSASRWLFNLPYQKY